MQRLLTWQSPFEKLCVIFNWEDNPLRCNLCLYWPCPVSALAEMYYLTHVFISLFRAWRIPWQRSWAGYSPQGRTESDTTAHMHIIRIYSFQKKILPPSPPKYTICIHSLSVWRAQRKMPSPCQTITWNRILSPIINLPFHKSNFGMESLVGFNQSTIPSTFTNSPTYARDWYTRQKIVSAFKKSKLECESRW